MLQTAKKRVVWSMACCCSVSATKALAQQQCYLRFADPDAERILPGQAWRDVALPGVWACQHLGSIVFAPGITLVSSQHEQRMAFS